MPKAQPHTWTQVPAHLPQSTSLSFIYHPLEDRKQQIYPQKKTFYRPTPCSLASSAVPSTGTLPGKEGNLPEGPDLLCWLTPFLGTLHGPSWFSMRLKFLVTSFWFHSFLGLTALLPPLIHSHLTLWDSFHQGPAKLILDSSRRRKMPRTGRMMVLTIHPLLVRPHWGNYVPFWTWHSQRAWEKQVAIQRRNSSLVRG